MSQKYYNLKWMGRNGIGSPIWLYYYCMWYSCLSISITRFFSFGWFFGTFKIEIKFSDYIFVIIKLRHTKWIYRSMVWNVWNSVSVHFFFFSFLFSYGNILRCAIVLLIVSSGWWMIVFPTLCLLWLHCFKLTSC